MRHQAHALLLLCGIAAATPASAEPRQASKLLNSCKICHDLSAERKKVVGPPLFGIAGSTPSIDVPFKAWDEAALDQWLSGPAKLKPDTQMNYQVNDPRQRAAIVEALLDLR